VGVGGARESLSLCGLIYFVFANGVAQQVKGKLDELEMLMITSRQRQPSDECELMNALNVTPPSSNGLRNSRDLISQAVSPPSSNPLEQTFRNFLRCDTLSDEDEDPSFNVDRTRTRTKKRTNPGTVCRLEVFF
jgi:hypothetical protein